MTKNNKLIKLENDFMFSDIFNREHNVPKLEKFIAVYFGYPYEKVHGNLKLIKRRREKNSKKEARKEVDLLLTLDNMKQNINIEIDRNKSQRIKDRNTTYIGKVAGELNIKESDKQYKNIHHSRQIAFNINNKPNDKNLFIDEQRIMSVKSGKVFSNTIEIDEINMSLIDELDYNLLEEKEKICYDFVKLLKTTDKSEFERISENLMNKEESKDLTKQVEELTSEYRYIELPSAYANKEAFEESLKEEAFEDGKEEGIEQTKIDTAKKMLEKNLDINLISECTNLSIEEIKSLK